MIVTRRFFLFYAFVSNKSSRRQKANVGLKNRAENFLSNVKTFSLQTNLCAESEQFCCNDIWHRTSVCELKLGKHAPWMTTIYCICVRRSDRPPNISTVAVSSVAPRHGASLSSWKRCSAHQRASTSTPVTRSGIALVFEGLNWANTRFE